MKKLLLVLCFSITTFVSGQTSSLVIGGVLDLDVPEAGSSGKSLELVAVADIADLVYMLLVLLIMEVEQMALKLIFHPFP